MASRQEMFDALRRGYDAFNRRDVDAFSDLAADDVEIHDLPSMPDAEVFRGRRGIEVYFKANWEVWEQVWGDIDELLEAGPQQVLALAQHGGRARGGPDVTSGRGVLVVFDDAGKMREVRFVANRAEALAATGLSEHTPAS